MKSWDSAKTAGTCAYDITHTWKTGARIGVVSGGTWQKRYCADCFRSRHGAPEDTGEVLETEDTPTFPAPLRAIAARVREERFDGRMAAAGKDED